MSIIKKIAVVLTAVTAVLSFWGCDAILERTVGWMEENIRYEYEVTVSFEDESDTELFEARLEALKISITESDGGKYLLDSHYVLKDGFFDAVCSDSDVTVVNELGSEILSQKSIDSASFDGVILELMLDKAVYEDIAEEISETLYLSRGEHVYEVITATEESENSVVLSLCEPMDDSGQDTLSGYERASIMLVCSVASDDLSGDASVNVAE